MNEPHFLSPTARVPLQVGQGTPPQEKDTAGGWETPPAPKSGALAPDPPKGVREPLPHSLPEARRQAGGPVAASSGRRGSQDPRGLPKPPAPPPQGGRRGPGAPPHLPSAWRPKKTERERGERASAAKGGGKRMRPGEKASEKERASGGTPTDPALPSSPPPLLLRGPAQHGRRPLPPPPPPPLPPRGRRPNRAGSPDLSSGAGRRWRRCGNSGQASGGRRGGEGVDGGGGDGGGGGSDGGGGRVPSAASIVPLGGGRDVNARKRTAWA